MRFYAFKSNYSYKNTVEIASFVGLRSLKTRRLVHDVTFMYKILNGGIDCPELLQKVGLKVPSFNSRFNPPFSIPHSNKNYIINSPMCRLPTSCNLLHNVDFYFDSCTKLKNSIYNLNVDG